MVCCVVAWFMWTVTAAAQMEEAATFKVRAQVTPLLQTIVSNQIPATIFKINVDEGEFFKAADLLIQLDCANYEAELRKAEAQVSGSDAKFQSLKRLKQLSSASTLEIRLSEAELKSALATKDILQNRVNSCRIEAPFSGRLLRAHVTPHQFVKAGDPLILIADDTNLELELLVPSKWLSWLRADVGFHVHVDELNITIGAKVKAIGAYVNPISQLIKITATLDERPEGLLIGMSGDALFPQVSEINVGPSQP